MRASLCFSATPASAVVRPAVSGPEPRTSMSMPESVAVTWMSSGLFAGFRISAIAQAAANRAVEAGRQDRAAVDGDDVVRARRREADFQHILGAAPRMQHGAPAALRHARRSVGATGATRPACASASTTSSRFHR